MEILNNELVIPFTKLDDDKSNPPPLDSLE